LEELNHQTGNWPSLIEEGWPGRFIGTPQNPGNNLANRENHLAAEGGTLFAGGVVE
jgi:hypothetical protein